MSLEKLREKRRKWVDANRENGFEDGIKRLLTELYPDNAHFIYELLQNAEDTRAPNVRFTLTERNVEFEHDGDRLFLLKDVESITSIGTSTKRDDPTSIGKFGVGFKAVFAYTNTPEIHSGDFHFRIHDLVVPETEEVPRTRMGERETRFVFPFDNQKKPRKQAVEEVELGLRALGDNTLLFLSHIRKIEYLLPDGALGTLERIENPNGQIEIHTSQPGRRKKITHWLRFEKDVAVKDEDGKAKTCRIAIAYSLTEEEGKKGGPTWKIDPLEHGQVSIYFPAEKETSNLRFHIHASFASTVARDSVRDCNANHVLRDHIAELVVESLSEIRNQGMLTVGFLAALPNPQDNLPDFYEPIRKAIVLAFKDDSLTPTRSGSHAPANSLYRGPARIQEVLDDDDLSLLMQYEAPLWAKNPPLENQREARFLESLAIEAWGWQELVETLSEPHGFAFSSVEKDENVKHSRKIHDWIAQKNDAWLMRFYALLGEACNTHDECLNAKDLSIVRVEAANGYEHVIPNNAFFPPEQGIPTPRDISLVKPTVYSTGRSESQKKFAELFLKHIGVRPFDAKATIELSLAHYRNPPTQVTNDYYKDVKQFINYWKKNPTDAYLFRSRNFLLGVSVDKEPAWLKPTKICLDVPYDDTGLADLTTIHGKHAIWDGYKEKLTESQLCDFVSFLKATGVMYELKVESTTTSNNACRSDLRQDWARSSARWTNTAIDTDYSIPDIEKYLSKSSVSANRLIWNALCHADNACLKARFRPNQQYSLREADSQLVHHLKKHDWIPDKSGIFRKPQDMTKEDLRTDFPFDDRNGLLTAIGFGENARKRSEEYQIRNRDAQNMGFSSAEEAEEFAKARKEGITLADLRAFRASHTQTEQPKQSVPDPDRRRKNVLTNTADAPSKESVQRERSVQKGISEVAAQAKAYLRAKYKNPEGQLVCQCCRDEMPFKLPSGEHYFEAVQCIDDKDARHYQNRLALCPTCAAMYQYARETDDTELRRRIVEHSADDQADAVEIHVRLASRDHTLRFVGAHWFDLKVILKGALRA